MFSQSRMTRAKIDFKAVLKPNSNGNVLRPTYEWNAQHGPKAFWKQFINVSSAPHHLLDFPQVAPPPAAKVFAALPLEEKHIRAKFGQPLKHARIEQTMKKMGYPVKLPDGMTSSLYQENAAVVRSMPDAYLNTNSPGMLSFSACFLALCGASDPAHSVSLRTKLNTPSVVFGKHCSGKSKMLAVVTPKNDLVLVLEEDGAQDKFRKANGYMGQVIGEMLMAASLNARLKLPFDQDGSKIDAPLPDTAPASPRFNNVYALRFLRMHLTGFRLDVTKQQVLDVVSHGTVPKNKMVLKSTVADPEKQRGWDLTKAGDRHLGADFAAAVLSGVKSL